MSIAIYSNLEEEGVCTDQEFIDRLFSCDRVHAPVDVLLPTFLCLRHSPFSTNEENVASLRGRPRMVGCRGIFLIKLL